MCTWTDPGGHPSRGYFCKVAGEASGMLVILLMEKQEKEGKLWPLGVPSPTPHEPGARAARQPCPSGPGREIKGQ